MTSFKPKHLVRILNKYLTNLKISKIHKLITYELKDLYVNIPIEETLTITKSRLLKSNDTQTTQQIITLMRLVLSQNYFTFQNKVYQPEKGVSMGPPISSTIAEIFPQYIEDIHIKQLLDTKNIFYTLYVDSILILYDTKITHPNLINTHINQIYTNTKLNPTYKNNGCISFLDVYNLKAI
jgi:hypothetical protein